MGLKKFDGKINGNNKKVPIIVITAAILILGGFIAFFVTFAKFKVTNSYNVIEGVVKSVKTADIVVSIKLIDSAESIRTTTDLPSVLAYDFNETKTGCSNGSTISFDKNAWAYKIIAGSSDKCSIYFDRRNAQNVGDVATVGNLVKFDEQTYQVIKVNDDSTVKIKLNSSIGQVPFSETKNLIDAWYSDKVQNKYDNFIDKIDYCTDKSKCNEGYEVVMQGSTPTDNYNIYPVLNIRADVALYGSGTADDMFRLVK